MSGLTLRPSAGWAPLVVALLPLLASCKAPNPRYHLRISGGGGDAGSVDEAALDGPPAEPDAPGDTDDVDGPPPAASDGSLDAGPDRSGDGALDRSGTDAPTDSTRDGPPRLDTTPDSTSDPACGRGKASLTGVAEADGVAITPDGTLYFTTSDGTDGWVGRIRPGLAPEPKRLKVPGGYANWGLAVDSARSRLYVAAVSGGTIHWFDISQETPIPTARTLVTGLTEPNDLAIGKNGAVYYSHQGNGRIYQVPVGGTAVEVTTSVLGVTSLGQAPSALAFGPSGVLFAGLRSGGAIFALGLTAARESSRDPFGTFTGWVNGMAIDRAGRLYVGTYHDTDPTSLYRITADGLGVTTLISNSGRFAGMAFGRGALDCYDLYLADPQGPMRVLTVDERGLLLP
jgi:sugar lactone lactonase YvrE